MSGLELIGSIVSKKATHVTNVTNDIKNNKNNTNVNNVRKSPYTLRPDFKENCPEATLSLEMIKYFDDEASHAFYWKLCLNEGEQRARFLFDQARGLIKEKTTSRTPVRDKKKFFAFMYKKGLLPLQSLKPRNDK